MGIVAGNRWKFLIALSIILPMTFLFAFKLSDNSAGPTTVAENMTLTAVTWQRERPNELSHIPGSRTLEINHSGYDLFFSEVLSLSGYDPDWLGFGPSVYIGIVNLTVSLNQGFVEAVNLNITDGYVPAEALFYRSYSGPNGIVLSGLQVSSVSDALGSSSQLAENSKFYLQTIRTGEDRAVSITHGAVLYAFKSPSNYTHQIDIASEIVYFNGTVYKSVTQPVRLVFGPDTNDSPQSAEQIEADGVSREFYIGLGDDRDFYKVYLRAGEKIQIVETEISLPLLYLFAPNNTLTPWANSTELSETNIRLIESTVPFSGWWYIEVDSNGASGCYTLMVVKTK